jgi:hypothetical protein
MQVQVISGDGSEGSANILRHLKELQDWIGAPVKTIYAEAYGAVGLVEILEVRAANEKEILVLACSREQIQAVLEWQSATEEVIELERLVIYLVRQIETGGSLVQ